MLLLTWREFFSVRNWRRRPLSVEKGRVQQTHERNRQFAILMDKSGWKLPRIADELGVTLATVSRYARGEIVPSLPVLRLFADILGEPLMLAGEPAVSRSRSGSRFLEDWEHELVGAVRRLPAEERKNVAKALNTIMSAFAKMAKKSLDSPAGRPANPKTPSISPDPAAVGEDDETDDERHKRVADVLGEAVVSELDAARKARGEPTNQTESERSPRDPSRSTSQRSVPGHRRSTTEAT